MKLQSLVPWFALIASAPIAACGGGDDTAASSPAPEADAGADAAPKPVVDVIVDNDRSGQLDPGKPSEEAGKTTWDDKHGAILLANLDDDDGKQDADANDGIVNGDDDVQDLAPIALAAWPDAPEGATGLLTVDALALPQVHLFRVTGDASSAASYAQVDPTGGVALTAADLRAGVSLAIEATDFPSSTAEGAWRGLVDLTLVVKDAGGKALGSDTARMRVAPLLFQHNLAKTEAVYYTDFGFESSPLLSGLTPACADDGSLQPTPLSVDDQWSQDFFDVGFTSRPGPNGEPIGMKIAVRTADDTRDAGSVTTDYFRGPGWGSIWKKSDNPNAGDHGGSLNSFGNWDVIPPYTKGTDAYPLGRNFWGRSDTDHPDPLFEDFVKAQEVQPHYTIDTTWLNVGHVDEITSWVKASTPRGWRLLVASPKMARDMLLAVQSAGNGSAVLFQGKSWLDQNNQATPAAITVDALLADQAIMAESQSVQTRMDALTTQLKTDLGLADDEVTELPFLWEETYGAALAYQPGSVNLLHIDGHVVIPDPFGPVVGGVDVFKDDLEKRLGALGLTVHFTDDWDLYHRLEGEVHCGTNVSRTMTTKWWESGR